MLVPSLRLISMIAHAVGTHIRASSVGIIRVITVKHIMLSHTQLYLYYRNERKETNDSSSLCLSSVTSQMKCSVLSTLWVTGPWRGHRWFSSARWLPHTFSALSNTYSVVRSLTFSSRRKLVAIGGSYSYVRRLTESALFATKVHRWWTEVATYMPNKVTLILFKKLAMIFTIKVYNYSSTALSLELCGNKLRR